MVQYLCITLGDKIMYMPYTTNPKMPKVRMKAVNLVRQGWSTRKVARYTGFNQSTIVRWVNKAPADGRLIIPTKNCRPHDHPNSLPREIVRAIILTRQKHNRCAEVVYQELTNQGIKVSLSSVKRTLDRYGMTQKRSPWKRYHPPLERPKVSNPGDLIQVDTIHLMQNPTERIYVYTLLDVFSRWAFACASDKISAGKSINFVKRALKEFPGKFKCLQTDHGPEFSSHVTERIKITHRHSRVRKPNDNAHLERFNRTIQQELLNRLPKDVKFINRALPNYLNYYNTERLHLGIDLKTPIQVMRSY
jgi:transposase InsO family protein